MLGTPNRDRVSERREATRREILIAAWTVARDQGLAQLTLREVADRVGMRAPSLYSHYASKNAIYDAMFGQAWSEFLESSLAADTPRPRNARAALRRYARMFFDFAVADLARHQLMNQRTVPGFVPSQESYAPAIAVIALLRDRVASYGITRDQDVDLFTAIVGGLVDAQLANDPGGDRYGRLLDRAIDMYADNLGL
ncbi:MAG: TetR/AcrR family transcriptional regulator [Nocardioidaceae bacterium]